jgi:hypothetical protein
MNYIAFLCALYQTKSAFDINVFTAEANIQILSKVKIFPYESQQPSKEGMFYLGTT